jgi:hypothetical protein
MSFPNTIYGKKGWEKKLTSTQRHKLGTRMALDNGKVFRYCLVGGTEIAAGRIVQAPATVGAHDMDLAVSEAAAVGATTVTVGTSLTVTKDQYKEGLMYVNDGAGEGTTYDVKSNTAVSGAAGLVVTLDEEDGLSIALTTSSLVGLTYSMYDQVIVQPLGGVTNVAAGVSPTTMTADYYGWLQTWGYAAVLMQGVAVVGDQVGPAETSADGAGVLLDSSSAQDNESIGVAALIPAVSTDFQLVKLTIDP